MEQQDMSRFVQLDTNVRELEDKLAALRDQRRDEIIRLAKLGVPQRDFIRATGALIARETVRQAFIAAGIPLRKRRTREELDEAAFQAIAAWERRGNWPLPSPNRETFDQDEK